MAFDAPIWLLRIRFQTQVVHQAYIEPHSCCGESATIPAAPKSGLAARCRLRCGISWRLLSASMREKFLVHPCNIGGDFGGKGDFMDVPLAYVLSLQMRQAGENADGL